MGALALVCRHVNASTDSGALEGQTWSTVIHDDALCNLLSRVSVGVLAAIFSPPASDAPQLPTATQHTGDCSAQLEVPIARLPTSISRYKVGALELVSLCCEELPFPAATMPECVPFL